MSQAKIPPSDIINTMNVKEVLSQLNALDTIDEVAPCWEDSQALIAEGGPVFLQSDKVMANLVYCGFSQDTYTAILKTAENIRNHEALSRLAWHCYWRVYDAPQESYFTHWPSLESVLGKDAGIFYLLVGIGFVPKVQAHHVALKLPEWITRQTCLQPRSFCTNYQMMTGGKLGIPRSQLWWLRYYTCKPYIRLGRLEFWLTEYRGNYHVYRSHNNNATIVLAPDNERYDADGYQPQQDSTTAGGWTSSLIKTPNGVSGYPITPFGNCLSVPVTLLFSEWRQVLKHGDTVLDLHIPAGGKMSPEACQDSFKQAAALFPALFPDNPPRAIVCHSWIYSPYLGKILPSDSNLVRNAMEPYLVPYPSGGSDGLWFIFFQDDFNLTTAPRQTSLQQTFGKYLDAGNPWRDGGMIHMLEDIPQYGNTAYRTTWPEVCRVLNLKI
jgi:hypothetical protein